MKSNLIHYSEYPYKDDYLEKSLNSEYADCFPPRLVDSGMIDWKNKEEAACWGGAWEERYAACKITDYTLCLDIPTIEMVNCQENKFYNYSLHYIQFQALKRMFGWRKDFIDAGHYGYFLLSTKDGKECSRSELTHAELETFLRNATPEELAYREQKIKKENKHIWWKETPTKEFPVKIYMFGNDDCSYSKMCKNENEAIKIVNEIIKHPKMEYIHKNFVFTN